MPILVQTGLASTESGSGEGDVDRVFVLTLLDCFGPVHLPSRWFFTCALKGEKSFQIFVF